MSAGPERPTGIWGTVLLPVTAAGEIDCDALDEEVRLLCDSGVAGIYTNGTAGEFHLQTEAEFDRVTELVARRAVDAKMPFQIGVSHPNPRVSRDRLARIRTVGASGAQFILPDWWPHSMAELARFAEGMQEAADGLSLILYNPPHAKIRLSLSEIAELRRIAPGIVGAKLPGGDADWYKDRRERLPDFSVFVPGHTVAFGRPLGADGAYSNVACLSPRAAGRIWTLAESAPARAVEHEARVRAFLDRYVVPLVTQCGVSNAALDKMLAVLGGWAPVGRYMLWPHLACPQDAIDRAMPDARALVQTVLADVA
ncbi:dihydrodipicolinate synthase family protein [Psychromarinibacter sp. C21-152]|uniref:Dihydrodipicolinate synthase family protein n=1 Tax=Psychromarinibacter sediminicola TaxID=3033385 RepID=A0AAE3NPQ0_9RHOB|nr:dihydrodipicolinate synthase family protein [Psychromarinibacter sediminicola]MDF0599831.1 dihydrodipicolinate synthase family protein [Psychromarinibacter sediminicola]